MTPDGWSENEARDVWEWFQMQRIVDLLIGSLIGVVMTVAAMIAVIGFTS